MNHDTLNRFVKDQKIPITIFDEPYFSYFLDLYDEDFGTKKAYHELEKTVAMFDSEEAFLQTYYDVRDAVITKTEELPEYKEFLTHDMKDFAIVVPSLPDSSKCDVYNMTNIGKYFVSIDMRKANFQVMKKYNPAIVFGANTYEEYISKFTDLDYIKKSKYTRQVIFGNMNPKRQTTIQRFYMRQIFDLIVGHYSIPLKEVAVFTNDEIVLRKDGYISEAEAKEMEKLIKDRLDIDVSVTSFRLNNIGDRKYFVKEKSDGTIVFKGVPSTFFPQAYKKYKGLPINDYDLVFFHEGIKAKFLEPIF